MKSPKIVLKYALIVAMLFVALYTNSYAGGFPIKPKGFMFAPSLNYFTATKGWDTLGIQKPFSNNGRFTSVSVYLYSEYGLSKRASLITTLPFVSNNYSDDSGYKNTSAGFTDLEIGLRYLLTDPKKSYYLSVQGTLIQPLYTDLNLGYKTTGAEIRLLLAGSVKFLNKDCYYTIEDGVRRYFSGSGPTQNRYIATFGVNFDKKFKHQANISLNGFQSASSFDALYNAKLVGSNKDFSFNQATISYGYSFTKNVAAFVSAGTFISGRNTGNGSSLGASLVIKP